MIVAVPILLSSIYGSVASTVRLNVSLASYSLSTLVSTATLSSVTPAGIIYLPETESGVKVCVTPEAST